ncbi:LOW QUALITY PROTEIN: hydrocephalus-inducing protein homolog [Pelodytes ibericus]
MPSGKLPSGSQSRVVEPRNPKLTMNEGASSVTLTPSAFLREMSLTTEQRLSNTREMHPPQIIQLLDMSETTHQKFSSVDLDQALFQPYPSEIVFQNYTPCETYEVPLTLRNSDQVPRLVKVIQDYSPYFRIISPNDVCHKVAPGMASMFRILFTPDEPKDYFHEVICITEREKFLVPIRAVGARAVLDFPDQLTFQLCPVKYSSQKTLLVRNIGNREACFQLLTQRPFSVEPVSGTLVVGGSMQVIVEFQPQKVGDHVQDLIVHYDTGEDVHIHLYGGANDINVRLDKNSLTVEKTFLSLSNQRTVTIINRSDIITHFQWKALPSLQEEENQKIRFCSDLHTAEEEETDHFLEECSADPSLRDRLSLLSCTFQNRRRMLQSEAMLFTDTVFHIEPAEGDVWPNSSVEVRVLFKPLEAKIYQRTIYCDITGRESRLPLRIRGEGLGPKLLFNFDQLDIGKIFVGSTHSYEVILTNQGAIDGIFTLTPPFTALGSCFSFNPSEGIILPTGHQAIQISICCNILGDFCQDFQVTVDGSPEAIILTIRGCVIGPTFHFSVPSLNFGDVSFGFPQTLTCSLNNTSLVAMTFNLRIPGDGSGDPSVTSAEQILDDRRSSWRRRLNGEPRAREFSITPNQGTIRSQGLLDIQVTLCSGHVKRYDLALVVDVEGIGEDVLYLPITARCVVPTLYLEDPVVRFPRCFLHYPYQRMVTLTNATDLPGCYCLLPQESDTAPTMLFSSPMPCGVIQPHSTVDVPIIVEAQVTGELSINAHIAMFGHPEPLLELCLLCAGEGPVVHVSPSKLDFGSVQVLTDVSRTLHLINQSLIPASFQASMTRKRSMWRVDPSHGVVAPEGETCLTIIVHLDDTVSFTDNIQLVVANSNTYHIPVSALGVGSTIVTDREFAPALDLGAHFSAGPCRYHFTMTNRGRRTHQLYWMTEGFTQYHKRSTASHPPGPVFQLHPSRMELHPGQSIQVLLEGSSHVPKVVKERLLGQAIIGKQSGKEKVMTVDVTCEFVAPVLQISTRKLHFYVEKRPDDVLEKQCKSLTLRNITSLPLSVLLSLSQPFSFGDQLSKLEEALVLQVGQEAELTVSFDPTYIHDLRSRMAEDALTIQYAEHPHTDFVSLQGEVHFPNLHFPCAHIHFGCILNDTESTQYLEITNCSPFPVQYHWFYQTDNWESRNRQNNIHTSAFETSRVQQQDPPEMQMNVVPDTGADKTAGPEVASGSFLDLLGSEEKCSLLGVEEVFDILPLFGALQPGESQTVSFTFYGHAGICAQAKALCEVQGGPTYQISLQGEASIVSYSLSSTDIDYGVQLFDRVAEAEIILRNTGLVSFPYTVLNPTAENILSLQPGEPLIQPLSGDIAAGEEKILKVFFFPGIPESFHRIIQLQVAHLQPESISLRGEGVFSRICLDLPRVINESETLLPFLREAVERVKEAAVNSLSPAANTESPRGLPDSSAEPLLLLEVERLLVKEHAREQLSQENRGGTVQSSTSKLLKLSLPDYLLDFGFVILGEVRTHTINITNSGHFPVSFQADRRGLPGTGFSTELDRVKNLPIGQTETFQVKFDPLGANLSLGVAEVVISIQVSGGPRFPVRLRASVTMPCLSASSERVEFSPVQCGQCQIRSIQLYNEFPVPCEWTVMRDEKEAKIDKHTPMHLRKKLRQDTKPKAVIFEMIPATDRLLPGQKKNVEIKFLPQEERLYSQRLVLQLAQSSQRVLLHVQGQGLEPQLDFSPSMLELGPVLPSSPGDSVDVLVRNPCTFPIEFYSLEMDKQYVEEEKILQTLKGYDSHSTLLLPPRLPGDKLPPEILQYYEDRKNLLEDAGQTQLGETHWSRAVDGSEEEPSSDLGQKRDTLGSQRIPSAASYFESHSSRTEGRPDLAEEEVHKRTGSDKIPAFDGGTRKAVGELEDNPVSQAIARHLGVDTSSEGRAASNRRGIAIIVNGAPLTGKSSLSVALAQYYGIACLTIDSVVLEAISDSNSQAGLKARQLCSKASLEQALRESEEAASQEVSGQPGLSVEALAKHTAEGGQGAETKTGAQSIISRGNRGSLVAGRGKSESHAGASQPFISLPHPMLNSQSGSSPLPGGPTKRRLSVSASVGGEFGLVSCVLPEDVLQMILSERLQLNDCFGGVVFDGLDTLFARTAPAALHVLLKALNNRRHIYFLSLRQEYSTLKSRELAQRVQEEQAKLRAQSQEKAHMEEMDEEEYDNLPEEERMRIDGLRLEALRERKKREQEQRQAREERERKLQEELIKLREEEELRKKARRGKSRDSGKEDGGGKKSQMGYKQVPSMLNVKSEQRLDSGLEKKRPDSVLIEAEESSKRRKSRDAVQIHGAVHEDPEKDPQSDSEKQLLNRFKSYEASLKETLHILTFWDRVQGILLSPSGTDDGQREGEEPASERQAPSGKKNRRERERQEKAEKDRMEKERAEKERLDKLRSTRADSAHDQREEMGVPHFEFHVSGPCEPVHKKVLEKLPPVEEILDGLGLGPSGPPLPPPCFFSVVSFPDRRMVFSDTETLSLFTFIAASPDDPNVIVEDKKEPEPDPELMLTIPMLKEEQMTPTRGRSKKEKSVDTGRESQKDKRRSASLRKSQQVLDGRSSPPGTRTPISDGDQGSIAGESPPGKLHRLGTYRWIVPAGGEVPLRIHFTSSNSGNFDQTLNFEIVGTRRRYQLYCRGVCCFPTISQDPKVVFPHRKKEAKPDEIIHKKFILSSEVFEFGPLLCGKSREKYKAGQFPENMETITISNVSPMVCHMVFGFQHDTKAATFILDPPTMSLKANEKQELSVWAFPTAPGLFQDSIVCCVKDNPQPIIFRVSCRGVRPELELDRKQIHFDKILLHRKDTKTIFLRNSNQLPAAWRLTGLENLADDFSVSQDQGIVGPRSEYALQLHFKAAKATNVKKLLRLEVSDAENILGIVQLENIQVFAEAYDVALDISFPKGTDGSLDFGLLKVNEEAKQSISLKNKGKYEIGFSFCMEPPDTGMPDLNSIFSVVPQKGMLGVGERPTQVQVLFQSKKEVEIMDKAIVRCQVIEPSLGEEVIASIPIRVSVHSLYTKYRLSPASDINFGAMVLGSRKSCPFTLENTSQLEFRYSITKLIRQTLIQPAKKGPGHGMKRIRSREGSGSSKSVFNKTKRPDPQVRDMNTTGQARLTLGMFTVSPGFGTIAPGAHQIINVDCFADQLGRSEELLSIDISDRSPQIHPSGVPFRLLTEICTPGFVVDDIASIFEEHRIVKDARILQYLADVEGSGVYLQEENRFMFRNVLVGHCATARFKILNTGKVPCDVSLTIKPSSAKSAYRIHDMFEISPQRMNIASHSHCFASVTFTPQSMQLYQCIFEATVEGAGSILSKTRNLTFEMNGEGNLPRISVTRPALRNKRGNPLLLFHRLLIGQCQQLPLVLTNEGSIAAQLNIDMPGDGGTFRLKPKHTTRCIYPVCTSYDESSTQSPVRHAHSASLILPPGDTAEFTVVFQPTAPQRYDMALRLSVMDNQYEQICVQLLGEGYEDDITLDNIHSLGAAMDPAGSLEEDDVEAPRTDHIVFGDCHVSQPYQVTFTMTNHSPRDPIRYQWPSDHPLEFSPQVGHIHALCAKHVTVTLKSDVAVVLVKSTVRCNVSRISFPLPYDHVLDWDDGRRTVTWVDNVQGSGKRKVIQTDPEPPHTVLDGGSRELELLVSATVDHAKYMATCDPVQFKDTLLYQTRVYRYHMQNTGSVQLHYSWQVQMEGQNQVSPRLPEESLGSARNWSIPSRPSTALESVSSLLSVGADTLPFSIQPNGGLIPAGGTQEFLIKFSPLQVGEYEGHLACSIPNLCEEQQQPGLIVRGRSLLPYCHFQLEDSDYITSGRRNPELGGPCGAPSGTTLDPNTQVIEFSSVGVSTQVSRRFGILNPTNTTYSFLWSCEDPLCFQSSPAFQCLTEQGVIQSEKKVEVTFQYIPHALDITESFWSFTIPEKNISVPFLLVGKASEPCLSLDRTHINFRSLLLGHEAQEKLYLINNEDQSFNFSMRESSCYTQGYSQSLAVTPMAGVISPRSRLPISITINPSHPGDMNFNVIFDIQTKTEPLHLNVKAEGHSMEMFVQCQDSAGKATSLTPQGPNNIHLGQVDVNDRTTMQFTVMNNGRFPFGFSCLLSAPRAVQDYLSITPRGGSVPPGQQAQTSLCFHPAKKCILQDTEMRIKIENGPEVRCSLHAVAVRPGIHFSFTQHNFGNCFMYQAGMQPVRKALVITNKDDREISLECLYSGTAHFEVDFQSDVLLPGGRRVVTITFYPRAAILYQETLIFQMNGHSTQSVCLQGQGAEMKVEVADPRHKVMSFGAVRIGQMMRRSISVVNHSVLPVTCTFILSPSAPALQDPKILSLLPSSEVAIPAHGGVCKLDVQFRPQARIPPFAEEVMFEADGVMRSLLVLRGSSQGLELTLDQDYISFGAVVLHSQAMRRVILSNTGELGARFQWDLKSFQPDFSISPTSGYITAGSDVIFDVDFHPREISSDIHYENLSCSIEENKPLTLTLSGSCIGPPSTKEVVSFQCQVRSRQTQTILLTNKSSQVWNLQPIINGEQWRGADILTVDSQQQNKPYDITYCPLTMSTEGKKHQGSLFFPLPDGTGLMYTLQGIAEPPKSSGNIVREVPCKTLYTELLPVTNWLSKSQRFRVVVEMMKPERPDIATSIKGLDYLEVPGAAKRDYKLTFHSHKEGTFSTKVTFRNEITQEYLFYFVTFKATPPGIISTIEMVTPVRQSTAATVRVENPLTAPVTFITECKVPEINLPPQLTVPAQSEGNLMFEYQPLKAGEFTGRLTLQSNDLGLFQYELLLRATPAVAEKPLYFHTSLGSSQTLSAKFTNYTRQKTEYSCKVDHSDFHVDRTVMAAPGSQGGSEVSVEVTYEPIQLGETRAVLLLSSPLGGEYTIPLFGSALSPKPQGPLPIRAGSSISIPFKNVFLQTTSFTFQTDPPAFSVKPSENVRPKKTHNISVVFEAPHSGSKVPVTGKLVVSCPRATGAAQGICWVYYLKGLGSDK